ILPTVINIITDTKLKRTGEEYG
ncbi:hypothetical protein A5868_000425, partial [Enterococcus sp. 12F9_DIV0723]